MIKEFSSYIKDNMIEEIKNFLVEDYGENSWKDFVDHQKMGDCQGIVASIIREFPQAKKVFGGIKLDEPCVDWDDGSANDEVTHHWVEIYGDIYDFSKGTLKGYIDGIEDDMYEPDVIDDWRYKEIGYFLKKEGWNPFKKKRVIPTNTHSEFDPYGEEVWDDESDILKSNFFILDIENKWKRIFFKTENKYLLVMYVTENNQYITVPSFEFGFTSPFFNKIYRFQFLQRELIDNLRCVTDEEFSKILDELQTQNIDKKISNLELLKSRFIN